LQNNWIDLARLAVQGAILAAVVGYGRKLLRTLRASQEQVGALLKLSVSNDVTAQPALAASREPEPEPESEPLLEPKTFSSLMPEPLHAPASTSAAQPAARNWSVQREQSLGGRVVSERARATGVALEEPPDFTPWIAAPDTEPQHSESRSLQAPLPQYAESSALEAAPPAEYHESRPLQAAPAGNRVSSWLQAPMSRPSRPRVNPLRRVVRWLQAPAGS
jgi:hypothetical protein